jgi:hypothetical protein
VKLNAHGKYNYKFAREIQKNAHFIPAKLLSPILRVVLDLCLIPVLLHTLDQIQEAIAVDISGLSLP